MKRLRRIILGKGFREYDSRERLRRIVMERFRRIIIGKGFKGS